MKIRWIFLIPAFGLLMINTNCTSGSVTHRSTKLVDYVYPKDSPKVEANEKASLALPVKVGVAFVPGMQRRGYRSPPVDSNQMQQLLQTLETSFEKRQGIQDIIVIPTHYLKPGGSFENMEQIANLYNIDLLALASIDQIHFNDPNNLSIGYITVVGMFLLNGNKNETRTMIDLAIFDVESKKMLFREFGTDESSKSSSLIDQQKVQREQSEKSFALAMENLREKLETSVDVFMNSIITGERTDVTVENMELFLESLEKRSTKN